MGDMYKLISQIETAEKFSHLLITSWGEKNPFMSVNEGFEVSQTISIKEDIPTPEETGIDDRVSWVPNMFHGDGIK